MAILDISKEKSVVIMEDNQEHLKKLKSELEAQGYLVYTTISIQDLEQNYMRQVHSPLYILDINMGEGREHEGIEAARQIRDKFSNACIVSYSSNSNLSDANKKYFNGHVEKTTIKQNAKEIIQIFKCHMRQIFERISQEIKKDKSDLKELKNIFLEERNTDINYEAYQKCQFDLDWIDQNKDYYVVFIDGNQLEDRDFDISVLIEKIAKKQKYTNENKLIVKVEGCNYQPRKTMKVITAETD
jgi:CheY-like chemotaxis protein